MKIIIIGAGPAGEAAAKYAAKQNAEVLLVEEEKLGGLCLNRGCIPSKSLLSYGRKLHGIKSSTTFNPLVNLKSGVLTDCFWQEAHAQKEQVVESLRAGVAQSLKLSKVQTVYGRAEFISPQELKISEPLDPKKIRTESFDRCIIAAGSQIYFPPPFDAWQKQLLDSDRILSLRSIPRELLIVGAGAVGCEFACLYNELGSQVSLVELTSQILPGEDEYVSSALKTIFEKRGIKIRTGTTVQNLNYKDGRWQLVLSSHEEILADQVLVCIGRKANCENLNLAQAQVRKTAKGIEVHPQKLQTSNPNIYAAGDVNGISLLAPAGAAQGETAAANALGINKAYKNELVPRCLYTWPEVSSVGEWKRNLENEKIAYKTQRFFYRALGKAVAEGEPDGFVQVLSALESGQILGAQIIGAHATEIIHILALAIHKKMDREELKEIIFAHPTMAESIHGALER